VDKQGQTIDFLLTEERDEQAAKRFLTKAIRCHGVPEKITIDGSAANEAAIKGYNAEHGTTIEIRKIRWCPSTPVMRFCRRNTTKYVLHKGRKSPDCLAVTLRRTTS
jgi:transposase-like protein